MIPPIFEISTACDADFPLITAPIHTPGIDPDVNNATIPLKAVILWKSADEDCCRSCQKHQSEQERNASLQNFNTPCSGAVPVIGHRELPSIKQIPLGLRLLTLNAPAKKKTIRPSSKITIS